MNIVLGIIGAAVASWLFGLLGITFADIQANHQFL